MKPAFRRILPVVMVCLALAACETTPSKPDLNTVRGWFAFVEDGKTREEDVLLRLGSPSGTYGRGRIFVYKFHQDADDVTSVIRSRWWWLSPHETVLQFDDGGILRRHSFLDTQAPQSLAFLKNGNTTRADIMLRLGEPFGVYGDGRNFTYPMPLVRKKDDWVKDPKIRRSTHLLVLKFGRDGILQDHRFLDMTKRAR